MPAMSCGEGGGWLAGFGMERLGGSEGAYLLTLASASGVQFIGILVIWCVGVWVGEWMGGYSVGGWMEIGLD
jgi:hypothetical protein